MKIPNPYFAHIPIIGDLIMDYIIFEYDYPLLFVCKTKDDDLYVCDCCDTYKEQRWLIAPITVENVYELLNNKRTIREVFEKAKGLCCVATWSMGDLHEKYKLIRANEFADEDLPEAGQFVDAEDDEHAEYISRLKNRLQYRSEQQLDKKIKIQIEDEKDSVEFNGLVYQYQKDEMHREIIIAADMQGTLDGIVTQEASWRNYSEETNNKQSTNNSYYPFAA